VLAVNTTLPPAHIAVGPDAVILALPALNTVTLTAALMAEQPLLLVTLTV